MDLVWGLWGLAGLAGVMGFGLAGLVDWWWWLGLVIWMVMGMVGGSVVALARRPEGSAAVIGMPTPLAVRAARWRPRTRPLLRQRDCLVPVTHSR